MSRKPSSRPPPFSAPASRGDVSPSAPAIVNHDQRAYVTEGPQIHDLNRSPTSKSETRGEISDEGLTRKDESDFSQATDSDARNSDMSVRRPLRPW